MSLLSQIIKNKKEEVKRRKKRLPLFKLKSNLKKSDRDFKKAISRDFNLIAEIKKGSPSGLVIKNFSLKKIAKIYEKNNNIKAISVLTDKRFFLMGINYLNSARELTKKPLLRKDFIIDEYQIYESRFYGADAILLIARILAKTKIRNFIELAKKYNMDCLVEIHDEKDLRKLPNNVEIIGINNRNLDTLTINLNATSNLIKKIPKDKILVSESGYEKKEDIDKIRDKVNAVLIGTELMRSRDVDKKISELFG